MGRAARALSLARSSVESLGLDPSGARVFRVGNSVLVELPQAELVARVEPPGGLGIAERQVKAAALMAAGGVPAMRLVHPEVLEREAGGVTLWERLEIVSERVRPETLGRLACQLHEACPEVTEAPPLDPLSETRTSLERLPEGPDRRALRRRLEAVEEGWPTLLGGASTLVHGDLHVENVLVTPRGPVIVDLEMAGRGPAAWDAVPQAVAVRRYGASPASYTAFCRGYGADPLAVPEADDLCAVYELMLVVWSLAFRGTSARREAEARVRAEGFLRGGTEAWTLL